ncbi:MAG: hypothetical protein AB7H88_13490 [Vicinamibacterales bacterium]
MAGTRRKWVPIAIGVAILLVFLAIGGVIFVTSYVRENLQVASTNRSAADAAFDEVRRQFPGQAPLLRLDEGGAHYTREEVANPPEIERVHVLAWDPREEKLARFSLPFWFLRLKSGPIAFSGYAAGLDNEVSIRPEDIQKHGPGLIIDGTMPDGARVLIWAQ